jgi:hypothetical protein
MKELRWVIIRIDGQEHTLKRIHFKYKVFAKLYLGIAKIFGLKGEYTIKYLKVHIE